MGSGGEPVPKVSPATSKVQESCLLIPSGFPAYKWRMLSWFLAFCGLYFVTINMFDRIQVFLQLPPSSPELCENMVETKGGHCWRADLFAFEVVSGLALVWCGIVGFWEWHVQRVDRHVPSTPQGRLFQYLPMAHQLAALGTTFQLFDLFVSLLIPEQRQPLFLCHHIMAATVSWYGLNNQVGLETVIYR